MSIETKALEIINEIIQLDDSVVEKEYDNIVKMLDIEGNFEQSLAEKLAYCRANYLTEDDLIEENELNDSSIIDDFTELPEIKRKLFKHIFSISARINDTIIENGLYPKVKVRVEIINDEAELPEYAHEIGDSGLDVKSLEDFILEPKKTIIVPTGIKVAIPLGYEIQVRPRSGNSIKYQDLFIANSPGTIDANYREEVGVILKNIGDSPIFIQKGAKIAQLVLAPVIKLQWIKVDDINKYPTERKGGFGSTGA